MRIKALARPLAAVVDFIYPPMCLVCGVRLVPYESHLCENCRALVLPVPRWRCRLCGGTGHGDRADGGGRCELCPPVGAAYRGVLSAAPYRSESARCVHLFKYERRPEFGIVLGRMMVSRLAEPIGVLGDRVGWIVPVPLHWRRRAWRGFNQAEMLGRELANATHIPMKTNVLRRVRATRMQVRVPADKRAENVRGAFEASRGGERPMPGVLLVDDVVTGGHTVGECARVLCEAGAPEVWVASFARAGA